MEQSLKYRLAGLAIIVLAAGVILPLIFDGEGYKERHLASAIPDAPGLPEVVKIEPVTVPAQAPETLAAPVKPVVVEKRPAKVEKAIIAHAPEESVDADAPVLDQQGVPVAWTLQLATFSDEANAKGLRSQLVKAGHKVYTRKQGTLVKVFVGPDLQRSKLEKLKRRLEKDFGLDGIIVRFSTQ